MASSQIYVAIKRQRSVYYLEALPATDTVLSLKEKLVPILQHTRDVKDLRLLLASDVFNKVKAANKGLGGSAGNLADGPPPPANLAAAAALAAGAAASEQDNVKRAAAEAIAAPTTYTPLEDRTVLEELNLQDGAELALAFWVPGATPSDGRWESVSIEQFPPLGGDDEAAEADGSVSASTASAKGKQRA